MNPYVYYNINKRGFTLSELLISLAVLGLIAALTLPAVFNSVSLSKNRAAFKEAYNAMLTAYADGFNSGELQATDLSISNMNTSFMQWLQRKFRRP